MSASQPVLVVDDDNALRSTIAEALTDEGYEVVQAANGAEALAVARGLRPALILLDMRMPVMNGWEFVQAYRESVQDRAPIVVCSAATKDSDWAGEVGADGYLPKPFSLEQLLDVAKRFAQRLAA
jgi:CheY-like chemotaxis protein